MKKPYCRAMWLNAPSKSSNRFSEKMHWFRSSFGAASVRSVSLRSDLVAGNDPLRPSVSVPALPAVLAGITDEIGFRSPDLGRAQPRNQDGIIDVSLPPFSADKTGAEDATVAIQAAVVRTKALLFVLCFHCLSV